jgi:putative ABC transport system permease protein
MVDIAWKSLLHDKVRFAITVSGVAFAVTLVLVQVGLFFGLLENATITIERSSADLWVTSRNAANIDFAQTFPEGYVHRVRSVPGVRRADNLVMDYKQVALPNGAQEGMLVYGLEDFSRWSLPWEVSEGDAADLRRGRYLFVDGSARKRYGNFVVGDYREVNGRRLKILGVTREALSFTTTPIAFMDLRLSQELSGDMLAGQTSYILVALEPGADLEAVRAEIRARLPHNDVFTKQEWAARSRDYWVSSTGLGLNMWVTVFLGCLVGVVVVAQTLYGSTMEHLKEFGTVKAIGGTNGDIYRIIAKQAAIAAALGFLVALVPSFGLAPAVQAIGLKLVIQPWLVASVLVGTLVFCLLAAVVSFNKVASIDPALVFRG